jgi:Putative Actinobacterial Holin-X, holin superfamily III
VAGADPTPPPSNGSGPAAIADAITEISEKATLLIHEEIELAKAEVMEKGKKLLRGGVVGGAAGIFAIFGLVLFLEGLAWLAYWVLPFPTGTFFYGFFVVALLLFMFAVMAGLLAARFFRAGAPPTPQMAIDEAVAIKNTVTSSDPEATIARPPETKV